MLDVLDSIGKGAPESWTHWSVVLNYPNALLDLRPSRTQRTKMPAGTFQEHVRLPLSHVRTRQRRLDVATPSKQARQA
jgi:hypothetical protein